MEVGQLLIRRPVRRHARPVLALAAAAALVAACSGDGDESTLSEPTTPSSIDAQQEVDTVPEGASEVCELLTDELITDLTGVSVVGIEGEGDTCTWSLTESAAVLGGPNEGGEASLEATFIEPEELADFEASDDPDVEVVPVDEIGDEALLVRRDGLPPTTLYVLDGDRALALSLANVLDGGNATQQALIGLAEQMLEAAS